MDVREKLSNEKRLIDANELKKKMCFKCNDEYSDKPCDPGDCVFCNAINDAQTIDAVSVVRCRDCIHYFSGACLKIYSDGNVSQDAWQERNEDDFCSYGERKEGAE